MGVKKRWLGEKSSVGGTQAQGVGRQEWEELGVTETGKGAKDLSALSCVQTSKFLKNRAVSC